MPCVRPSRPISPRRCGITIRSNSRVPLWNRAGGHAVQAVFGLAGSGLEVEVSDDLEAAVRDADIISCATLSSTPLVCGKWLKKGAHVDLVGGFTPKMREADDAAVKKARVYVDTRAGATKEAGDIVQPLKSGALKKESIHGDLFE